MNKKKPSKKRHFLQETAAEWHIPDDKPFILHLDHQGSGNIWDASMSSDPILERMEQLYKGLTAREREKPKRVLDLDAPEATLAYIAARIYEW